MRFRTVIYCGNPKHRFMSELKPELTRIISYQILPTSLFMISTSERVLSWHTRSIRVSKRRMVRRLPGNAFFCSKELQDTAHWIL
jgi:hypothetical protein